MEPPTKPEPLERSTEPPMPRSLSPDCSDTLPPADAALEPANKLTEPACEDALSPLDTRTEPVDSSPEPLPTSNDAPDEALNRADDTPASDTEPELEPKPERTDTDSPPNDTEPP